MADDILGVDHRTGDASGVGASGQTVAAHGKLSQSKPDGLLGCPVDFRLGLEPVSVCITSSPKIHAPAIHQGECIMSKNSNSSPRYIALDIHKHYALIAAVDREGQVLLKPRKVTNEQLPDWAVGHLCLDDRVVIESTTNAWHVYDLLAPLVAEVKVANPIRIKQIAEARTKTDKRDALILARLLAANLIPEVWVPPVPVRELRQLIS